MDGPGDGESTVTSSASEMMHMHEPYGGAYAQGHRHGHGHRIRYGHSHNWGVNQHEQPHGDDEKENERDLDPDLERFGKGASKVPAAPGQGFVPVQSANAGHAGTASWAMGAPDPELLMKRAIKAAALVKAACDASGRSHTGGKSLEPVVPPPGAVTMKVALKAQFEAVYRVSLPLLHLCEGLDKFEQGLAIGPDGGELAEFAGHMSVALAHLSSASSDVSVLLEQLKRDLPIETIKQAHANLIDRQSGGKATGAEAEAAALHAKQEEEKKEMAAEIARLKERKAEEARALAAAR